MTRPDRADERQLFVGVAGHGPGFRVHQVMVMLAEQGQVWQVGRALVRFPPSDVVGVDERGVRAAGEPAVAVPPHDLPTLRLRRIAVGPALVHGVADVVVDRQDDGRVTCDASDRVRTDQPVAFELAGQLDLRRRRGRPAGRGRRPCTSSRRCGAWWQSGPARGTRRRAVGPKASRRRRESAWPPLRERYATSA